MLMRQVTRAGHIRIPQEFTALPALDDIKKVGLQSLHRKAFKQSVL